MNGASAPFSCVSDLACFFLPFGDGTTKIFLNADSDADDVSKELRDFLDYVAGKDVDNDYVREVDEAVKAARMNKEWRNLYMTMMMRDLENQEIGREEGEQNAKDHMIRNMIEDGLEPEKIAKYAEVTVDYVVKIKDGELQIV